MRNKLDSLRKKYKFFWIFILFLLPLMFVNVPFLNLLFLGFDEKISYGLIVLLFILRPQIHKTVYFLFFLLGVQFISEVFYKGNGSGSMGLFLYIALIYLTYYLLRSIKRKD